MPLCWSCRSLFRKGATTPTSGCPGTSQEFVLDSESTFSQLYKHEKSSEEDMLKLLADMKKPEKVSKLSVVPGTVKISVESVTSTTLLSKPEMMTVIETKKDNNSFPNVIEFPINSINNFTKFVHLLYVYPLSLNLNPVAGKIRARNILCRVFLRTEDDIEASRKYTIIIFKNFFFTTFHLIIYDHNSLNFFVAALEQHPTGGSIATYVLHHRSNPEWYTEIKLSLPVSQDPRLHLLFQFFHISCSFDNKSKSSKPIENVVGYSWIPLLNKYRFIGGEHVLPVAATLPSGYLQIQPLGLGKGVSRLFTKLNFLCKLVFH